MDIAYLSQKCFISKCDAMFLCFRIEGGYPSFLAIWIGSYAISDMVTRMGPHLKKVDFFPQKVWNSTQQLCPGLKLDAQTALDYVTNDSSLSKTPIVRTCSMTLSKLTLFQILYGQSIGGAVAIDLASRNPSKVRFLNIALLFSQLTRLLDPCLDSRKHIHLSSGSDTQRPSPPLPLLISMSPEVGISTQDPFDTA